MTSITAYFIRSLSTPWRAGTSLYRLSHPYEFMLDLPTVTINTKTDYVIVAYTPRAIDHKRSENTIFLANPDGRLFGYFELETTDGETIQIPRLRVDERHTDIGRIPSAEVLSCRTKADCHRNILSKLFPNNHLSLKHK